MSQRGAYRRVCSKRRTVKRVACSVASSCDDQKLDPRQKMTTVFPLPSPTLPDFTTLLLKGPYHASAPIHLCLTHLANRPESRAVLLTPSRENFVAALRDFNDDWLNECGGYGAVSQILSRVDILFVSFHGSHPLITDFQPSYPPTALQASIVLSMLRDARPETAPSQMEIASPCLILLHEFSSYFLEGETHGW